MSITIWPIPTKWDEPIFLYDELLQGRCDLALGPYSKGIGHDKTAQKQSLGNRRDSDGNGRRMHGKCRSCASTRHCSGAKSNCDSTGHSDTADGRRSPSPRSELVLRSLYGARAWTSTWLDEYTEVQQLAHAAAGELVLRSLCGRRHHVPVRRNAGQCLQVCGHNSCFASHPLAPVRLLTKAPLINRRAPRFQAVQSRA
jgi:hypothetical protein